MARSTKTGGAGKSKKGTRKYGRNKVKCERYRKENRLEKNKARKAARREMDRCNWLANRI